MTETAIRNECFLTAFNRGGIGLYGGLGLIGARDRHVWWGLGGDLKCGSDPDRQHKTKNSSMRQSFSPKGTLDQKVQRAINQNKRCSESAPQKDRFIGFFSCHLTRLSTVQEPWRGDRR